MSTEKGTVYNINWDVFYALTEEKLSSDKLSRRDVFQIVSKSYGIYGDTNVNMHDFAAELSKKVFEFMKQKSILYLFFDISLLILVSKIVEKDEEKLMIKEKIKYNMERLCGRVEMVWD